MKIKRNIIFIILLWLLLVSISFFWNYTSAIKAQKSIAFESARSFFNHIVITRLWNAQHGGVYVPVTEETRPNPYLNVKMRDIVVNDKLKLTKVNPAYMTRQISEIAMGREGVQFHITSLKPIRPKNKPTALESEFLKEFEKGIREKSTIIKRGGKTYFFYMAPLITKKACLKCHAKQGYKEGDIRGGISVTLPFSMKIPFFPLLIGHILIWLAGVFGIIIAGVRLKNAYETIRRQAAFDALTGIPNRRSFMEAILREYRRCKRNKEPLSIIMCDVDHFKAFNDTYGHAQGDLCLKKVAQSIKNSLKRPGDFCARYGGEEFVVILPNTSLKGALHIAERIRENVEKMGIPNKNSLPKQIVTLSLGVASSEKGNLTDYEELVKQADLALYKAKQLGRNQVQAYKEENH